MLLLLALLLIGLEATYEALKDTDRIRQSYRYEFAYRVLVAVIFAGITQLSFISVREHGFVILLVGYLLLRFAILDPIYNAVHKDLPLDYIGNTKWWDKFLRRLNLHPSLVLFARAIALLWGAAWLLGWKNGIISALGIGK